jgi:N-acetyl-gamma-glutamyl-phosphate reductase
MTNGTTTRSIQTAVLGVTGYAGAELARLLVRHPRLAGKSPVFVGRISETDHLRGGIPLAEIHPQLEDSLGTGALRLQSFSWELLAERGVNLLFLATPHESSRDLAPEALKRGIRVIDLSGAWRLNDPSNRAVYKLEDEGSATAASTQSEAVYGMPELHRAQIHSARLVANPGCYATSVILAVKPLVAAGIVDLGTGIIADAKSGVSGAGKTPTAKTHFMYAADNLSAYGLFTHRHTGELLEQIGLTSEQMTFTPHLLPIPRGILSTIYLRFQKPQTRDSITQIYRAFFKKSPLVRLYENSLPQIQFVVRTNYADIGFELSADGKRAIIVSCLDNLLKGAAGQAVQNMNLLEGWGEAEGLE